jgi:hypothetical protein
MDKRRFGTMMIIPGDGSIHFTRRPADDPPDLKELQAMVGGLIEPIDRFIGGPGTKTFAYCNEEPVFSLPAGLATPNGLATAMVGWGHTIFGPVVIGHGFDPDPEDGEPACDCDCVSCRPATKALDDDCQEIGESMFELVRSKLMLSLKDTEMARLYADATEFHDMLVSLGSMDGIGSMIMESLTGQDCEDEGCDGCTTRREATHVDRSTLN